MTAGLLLMKSVLTPLAKMVLIPLGLSARMSEADAAIENKIYGSHTTLIISNEKTEYIMKIVKSLKESELLIKLVKQSKTKQNKKEVDFFQCY